MESGEVAIARDNHRVTYPARFMLVAAMNPCRCGQANDPGFSCARGPTTRCAAAYQGRLSGPLLDRIDLTIEVPAVTAADLILPPPTEGSRDVAARVARARTLQAERYAARAFPACAPMRRRKGRCSRRRRARTAPASRCCATRRRRCGSRRAAITACCGWR